MHHVDFEWRVPADHPAFAGHFPGRPIVPGVVLLDRALLFAEAFLGTPAIAWQIARGKFFHPVGPGETLTFALQAAPAETIAFSVRAGGREVAAGSLKPGR